MCTAGGRLPQARRSDFIKPFIERVKSGMKAPVVKVKYVEDEAKKPVVTIQVISMKYLSHAWLRLFFVSVVCCVRLREASRRFQKIHKMCANWEFDHPKVSLR